VQIHLPDGLEKRQRRAEFAIGDPLRQSAWLYGHDLEAEFAQRAKEGKGVYSYKNASREDRL
jgi:hypothetical protein